MEVAHEEVLKMINSMSEKQQWDIAEQLADERLPRINSNISLITPRISFYTKYGKRILDILIAIFALLVSLPINLIIAMVTIIDVGKPIFFRQKRVGKDGKIFTIYKFRNMTNDTNENGELLPVSQRITRCGAFWRKTSLDELLNFWSILKGDMSMIGPRPLPPEYAYRYSDRHKMRLTVRPGLECPPWKRLDHFWTWDEQFDNDVWYVENVSFWVDVQMCFKLVFFALDRKSARMRNVGRGSFAGYSKEGRAIAFQDMEKETLERLLKYDSKISISA